MKKRSIIKHIFIVWFTLAPAMGIYLITKLDQTLFASGAVLLSAALGLSAALAGMFISTPNQLKKKTLLIFSKSLKTIKTT